MFLYQLGLEGAGTIARRLELELAAGALDRLLRFTVLAILSKIFGQMRIELRLKRCLGQLLHERT